ncbi:ATP-dependent zinc metalloprotease FtsH [bioreactor metagenome]|uniref:ATP-dependent zinc metalloprotease FtsH n=1 Tax=bioreactor metagenome TaxID=1076179 RepID=A0A645HW56_9ZZZZ
MGESEKALREIFKKARQAAPCIVFFDEIDSMVPVRGRSGDSSTSERLICQMLSELDGIEELNGVTVIGATNRFDMLDPALLRPGRFDMLLEFKSPDLSGRAEIFKIHLRGRPLAADVDVKKLAAATEGFTGADIMKVCQQASMDALSEYIRDMEAGKAHPEERTICFRNFANAMGRGDSK